MDTYGYSDIKLAVSILLSTKSKLNSKHVNLNFETFCRYPLSIS